MRIVCDTNIIISALLFPGGPPDKIWRAVLSGRFENATSPDLLTELEDVFKKKFSLSPERRKDLLTLVANASVLIYPTRRLRVIAKDETDNRVLECALEAKAHCLITGDKNHLLPLKSFDNISILSPSEFLKEENII